MASRTLAEATRYNVEFFRTALPITTEQGGDPGAGLRPDRFRHFLWVLYPTLIDGLAISPTHQDLRRVAHAASSFLSDAFGDVAKDSGVKSFLGGSVEHGWDVKRKLVWLGTHSFMFRAMFARYMKKQQDTRGSAIGHTDDFVCQECTRWSGLGAIDILAGVLDVCDDNRRDLRNWYERHAAFYKVLSVEKQTLEALNVINDRPYRIKIDMKWNPFRCGQLVFGSLVPWRGEWCWSGEQKAWDDATRLDVDELKRDMKAPELTYRVPVLEGVRDAGEGAGVRQARADARLPWRQGSGGLPGWLGHGGGLAEGDPGAVGGGIAGGDRGGYQEARAEEGPP